MQPLTTKEVEYIVDSMSNEDLLTKQCLAAAVHVQDQQIANACLQLAQRHQQHYKYLLTLLQQHESLAPQQGQPQPNQQTQQGQQNQQGHYSYQLTQ